MQDGRLVLAEGFRDPAACSNIGFFLARGRQLESQPLALPLAASAGTYGNDLFGSWTIAEREGAREVLAGPARYRTALTPWNGETFHLR